MKKRIFISILLMIGLLFGSFPMPKVMANDGIWLKSEGVDRFVSYEGILDDVEVTIDDVIVTMLTDDVTVNYDEYGLPEGGYDILAYTETKPFSHNHICIYLLPFGTEKSLEGFDASLKQGEAYQMHTPSCRAGNRGSDYLFGTMGASFVYDSPEEYLESGVYEMAILLVSSQDPTSRLFFNKTPIRFSSSFLEPYISDDFYGYKSEERYVKTQAQVYLYDELLDNRNLEIKAYSPSGACFGVLPIELKVGEEISLTITPMDSLYEMRYQYDFPMLPGMGNTFTVPEDGILLTSISSYERETSISGYVKDQDGKPLCGIGVTAIQNLANKRVSNASTYAQTDINGYYCLENLYDYTTTKLVIDRPDFSTYTEELSPPSVTGNLSKDITLQKTDPTFSIKLLLDGDERVIKQAKNSMEEANALFVTDNNLHPIYGELVVEGDLSYSFYGNEEEQTIYELAIETSLIKSEKLSVEKGETVEVPCELGGAFTFSLASEDSYVCAFLFDSEGNIVDRLLDVYTTGEENHTFFGKKGQYSFVAFQNNNDIGRYIESYQDVEKYLREEWIVTQDISFLQAGEWIEGGQINLPKNEFVELSMLNKNSWMTVSAKTNPSKSTTVTAHIETNSNEPAKLTGLRIDLWQEQSKRFDKNLFGNYISNSLVINGKQVQESYQDGLIGFSELEIPCDLSFRIHSYVDGDFFLQLDADIIDDSQILHMEQFVGLAKREDNSVSIHARETTSTGEVLANGFAPIEATVAIYDNDNLIGEAQANQYGQWENMLYLPRLEEGNESIHKLYAVCQGKRSETVIVHNKPGEVVVKGLYICCNGERLGSTYSWAPNRVFTFEAEIENAKKLTKPPVFIILCSDDSVLELTSTQKREGVYVTEPCNDLDSPPVKILLSLPREEKSHTDSFGNVLYGGSTVIGQHQTTNQDKLIEILSTNKLSVTEGLLPENELSENEIYYLLSHATVKAATFQEKINAATLHTYIKNKDGNIAYEVYYIKEDTGVSYAYLDYSDGSYHIETIGVNSKEDYQRETMELAYFPKSGNKNELVLFASNQSKVKSIRQQQDDEFMKVHDEKIAPAILDYMLEIGMEMGYGDNAKCLPIFSSLMTLKNVNDAATNCFYANEELEAQLKELEYMQEVSKSLAQSGKDMTRTLNEINNAINSTKTAISLYNEYASSVIWSNIITYAEGYGGPAFEAIATAEDVIAGYMTDDMLVNADVVKRGSEGDVLDAQLSFLKATGLSMQEFREFEQSYNNGMVATGVRNKILDRIKDKQRQETNVLLIAIIDPSGYIYEAVASNRIQDATVLLYQYGGTNENLLVDSVEMTEFDAAFFGQKNPLLSNEEGRYAWDVPEGKWFVVAKKAGYEDGTSQNDPAATVSINGVNYLPVCPPQLDVNIPLTSFSMPNVDIAIGEADAWFSFDKYMRVDSLKDNCKVFVNGKPLSLDVDYLLCPIEEEISPLHTPYCGGMALAKEFEIQFVNPYTEEDFILIELREAEDYSGTKINKKMQNKEGQIESIPEEEIIPKQDKGDSFLEKQMEKKKEREQNRDKASNQKEEGIPVWVIIVGLFLFLGIACTSTFFFLKWKKNRDTNSGTKNNP